MASKVGWVNCEEKGTVGNSQYNNNKASFEALPSGYRNKDGSFYEIGRECFWWSSTADRSGFAWRCSLSYRRSNFGHRSYNSNYGFSIRCIKD